MTDGEGGRGRTLRIAHHHPGRVRLRADVFVDANGAAEEVRLALEGVDGVRSVRHAPATGSLLVAYDPARIEANRVIALVAGAAGLDDVVDGDRRDPADLAGAVVEAARAANAAVVEASGGRTDLRGVISAALAGASVVSLFTKANGPAMPRWDNLLWWSYSIMSQKAAARDHAAPRTPETDGSG